MRSLGESQDRVLTRFAAELTTAGRFDLARFLLRALVLLLSGQPLAAQWTGALDLGKLRLADRQSVYRSALALLQFSDVLRRWEWQARSIGYFDEGYAAGQLWKGDWEALGGEEAWRGAQRILREVEPFTPHG
jgi:FtsH ternary system domain X6